MNTSALKSFAQQARQVLREGVERRLLYWGFDKKGNNTERLEVVTGGYTFRGKVSDDTSVPGKWNKLKAAIGNTSFDEVVEKAAYTWFNRLLAMKILSQNGYETAQLDYLSDETNTPAILERARRGQYSFLSNTEQRRLQPLLTDYEKEQETFAILLIGFCHQHALLQGIFGSIDDYTELLLPDDILTENGFLYFLNTIEAISDEDYKQVELIGWLYQFYISEKKDEVFAGFKQNRKAEAKDIPAATQIFTPNWIVKYLVQNTLGRTWLDAHPESDLKKDWKYLVESSSDSKELQTTDSELKTADSLTFLDPAVGSGHILVEAFDTLYPMYMAEYYSPEEAVQSILEKNLFGLDLDLRAVQLAQFALILKAAQYSRSVLNGTILPHIYAMPMHRTFSREEVMIFLGKENSENVNQLFEALQTMEQADNLGSIVVLDVSNSTRHAATESYKYWQLQPAKTLEEEIVKEVFPAYVLTLQILTKQFACIATNPPYLSNKNMNVGLKNYTSKFYPNSSTDLFAVFMEVSDRLLLVNGRYGIVNQHSWMFLSSYKDLRNNLLITATLENMLHLGARTFAEISGEVVQSTAFVIQKKKVRECDEGVYFRLISETSSELKRIKFLNNQNRFTSDQNKFFKLPGTPIAYWANSNIISIFENNKSIGATAFARKGNTTTNNEKYVRYWFEINLKSIARDCDDIEIANRNGSYWFPYNKGGGFRRWYGLNETVLYWKDNGKEIKSLPKSVIANEQFYMREGSTWGHITSYKFSARYFGKGFIFDNAGNCLFSEKNHIKYLNGFLNSISFQKLSEYTNPTLGFSSGEVAKIPIIFNNEHIKEIDCSVEENISLSKKDWDSRETSWDFQNCPLIVVQQKNLEQSFQQWLQRVNKIFFQLQYNEEELNRIFIEIYGLQGELTSDVPLKDITILQEELDYEALEQIQKPYEGQLVPLHADVVMQQLISYAVGCYMGRYRLDKPGLHIAHPNPVEEEMVPYAVTTGENKNFLFSIDDDAIIPLMGKNGNFTDDMLYRINEFLSIVWGDDTLTANLNFLQQQLGKDLEDYLVKDFWKYHIRTYSKKPIYWLFASKKGAFQVLVYMHRMNAYTPAQIRSKYLIPHISWLQGQVRDMEKNSASLSKVELRTLDTRRKQLAECEEYDLLLKDIADKQISFDLDDGVTKNYALFEGVVVVIK